MQPFDVNVLQPFYYNASVTYRVILSFQSNPQLSDLVINQIDAKKLPF